MGWSFTGYAGITGNGSLFTVYNPDAPEGVQSGFLQETGCFTQPVTLAAAGAVTVSFQAARHPGTGSQEVQITLGSTTAGSFLVTDTAYTAFTTDPVFLAAGTYDLTFTGLKPLDEGDTAFLDAVQVTLTPAAAPGPLVADDPFGYLGGLGYWQDPALDGSGLSYVRQRWLENASGQWLSVDPVASEARYGYAGNSPTIGVDPSGTESMRLSPEYRVMVHARRQIRRGVHWAEQEIARGERWVDQQANRAIPWAEREIDGPWMGHALVALAEEGLRWAERQFGPGSRAGGGSVSSRRPTATARSPRRSSAGRHYLRSRSAGRAISGWLHTGLSSYRQAEAVSGNTVRLFFDIVLGTARRVIIDPLTTVFEAVSHASKQLYAQASQKWPRFTSILSQIWNTLERVFHTTTSHWERIRRSLPPILANVAPPPPTDVAGSAEYLIGLIWGALQALFGIVAAVATIPAVVEFLNFLFTKIGTGQFWESIWGMLKAQWDAFSGLFTTVQDLGPRERGEILGGVLITVILLVIEVLTGLAESGVALEFTAAGLLRVLKATGKLSLDAIKEGSAHLAENVSAIKQLGRGKWHGFPHGVEGGGGLLHGAHGDIDLKLAIGKVHGVLREHATGIVRNDVARFNQGRDWLAGAHMQWKGALRPGESALLNDIDATAQTSIRDVGRPGQPGSYGEGIRSQLTTSHYETRRVRDDYDRAQAEYDAMFQRVSKGKATDADLNRVDSKLKNMGVIRKLADDAHRNLLGEVLAAPDPIESIQINGALGDDRDVAMASARDFVASVTSRSVAPAELNVGLAEAVVVPGRRLASVYQAGTVHLTPVTGVGSAVHELGHWLEQESTSIRDRTFSFYDRRTAGNDLKPLGGVFDTRELAREGNFRRPYVGKEYTDAAGQRYATEVMSVGLQSLYNDPVRFATEDPDFFDTIIEALHGR